jgi:hypothetical protein
MRTLMNVIASGFSSQGVLAPIVTDGLIFNIDANDPASYPGSGSTVFDTANGQNGTLTNGCSFVESGGAKYFEFDGLDDYIEFGAITSSDPASLYNTDFSIEFWFYNPYVEPFDYYQRLIDKSSGGSGLDGYAFYVNSNSYNTRRIHFNIDGDIAGVWIGADWQPSTWYQYVVTKTGTTWRLWRNSTNMGTIGYNTPIPPDTANMRIGSWNHSTAREFKGNIAIVRMYDRPLNGVEVATNFQARKDIYGI